VKSEIYDFLLVAVEFSHKFQILTFHDKIENSLFLNENISRPLFNSLKEKKDYFLYYKNLLKIKFHLFHQNVNIE